MVLCKAFIVIIEGESCRPLSRFIDVDYKLTQLNFFFRFLTDLEKQWRVSCILDPVEICRLMTKYATQEFDVYSKYCSNKVYQDRKLEELM